jgi:hypothetical protein
MCLFLLTNILYACVGSRNLEASLYNSLFPGRTRLPFGIVGDPYTVAVDEVDVMFASHLIDVPKLAGEYRVVLIGDSSVWGEGLGAQDVISEQWNQLNLGCRDKTVRTYNLGYPHPSVVKDLVILEKALTHQPDLIIWFVTLNTLISQRANPFLTANHERTLDILNTYDISFPQGRKLEQNGPDFLEMTLIGQRSNLARWMKLQMMGIIWSATGADTNTLARDVPEDFHVGDSRRYRGMEPPTDLSDRLLFSAISAGHELAGQIPVLLVNEPMFIVPGAERGVRYNAGYPRWAYDQYREALAAQAQKAGWNYLDLWNAIPPQYFLDPALHLGVEGERLLVEQLNPALSQICMKPAQDMAEETP